MGDYGFGLVGDEGVIVVAGPYVLVVHEMHDLFHHQPTL